LKEVVNSVQMKAIDSYTIDIVNIPSVVLMERAALQVAECIKKYVSKKNRILAVCGIGNNGADGIATARILNMEGYQVDILIVGNEHIASIQAKQQLNIARNLGISIDNNIRISEYTIIIDAIFGIGLSKPVSGIYENTIKEINFGDYLVFSVDLPSGLSADTAKPLNIAVKADYTITFGLNKLGLILHPGCEYGGEVIIADIGFPKIAIQAAKLNYFIYDSTDMKRLPVRKDYSNKGNYGKVLIIAGSINMNGACFFSAKAAYRTGAGLVKVLTVVDNRTVMQTLLPEAILSTYDPNLLKGSNDDNTLIEIEKILSELKWATVIVIGPGIGVNENSEKLLDLVIKNAKVPLIIDADGINILANKKSANKNRLEEITAYLSEQTILTPHLKELSRLIGIPLEEITNNLIETANKCTYNNKLIYAIKDARTIVAYENARYINTSGNSGMATGGTGDVLTGVIAALIAQGLSPSEATILGVYIHGLAGDKAAEQKGKYALIASDIIEALSEVCM